MVFLSLSLTHRALPPSIFCCSMGRPRNDSYVNRDARQPSSQPILSPSESSNRVSFLYDPKSPVKAGEQSEDNAPRTGPQTLIDALSFAITRRKPLEKILLRDSVSPPLSEPLLPPPSSDASPKNHRDGETKLVFLDLLAIGIGGTIGSGVFVLTGDVQPIAGPSAVLSWLFAGLTCLLSAFSYMELSARIPTRGSCYIFCYTTLGELAAVIGGVCLTLEYGIR